MMIRWTASVDPLTLYENCKGYPRIVSSQRKHKSFSFRRTVSLEVSSTSSGSAWVITSSCTATDRRYSLVRNNGGKRHVSQTFLSLFGVSKTDLAASLALETTLKRGPLRGCFRKGC